MLTPNNATGDVGLGAWGARGASWPVWWVKLGRMGDSTSPLSARHVLLVGLLAGGSCATFAMVLS